MTCVKNQKDVDSIVDVIEMLIIARCLAATNGTSYG